MRAYRLCNKKSFDEVIGDAGTLTDECLEIMVPQIGEDHPGLLGLLLWATGVDVGSGNGSWAIIMRLFVRNYVGLEIDHNTASGSIQRLKSVLREPQFKNICILEANALKLPTEIIGAQVLYSYLSTMNFHFAISAHLFTICVDSLDLRYFFFNSRPSLDGSDLQVLYLGCDPEYTINKIKRWDDEDRIFKVLIVLGLKITRYPVENADHLGNKTAAARRKGIEQYQEYVYVLELNAKFRSLFNLDRLHKHDQVRNQVLIDRRGVCIEEEAKILDCDYALRTSSLDKVDVTITVAAIEAKWIDPPDEEEEQRERG